MSLQTLTAHGITWICGTGLAEDELRGLQQQYGFHELDIEDCLSENERPKIEEYGEYLFCVIHVPVRTGNRILKEEINVFIGREYVVTLSEGKTDAVERLWEEMHASRERQEDMKQGTGYLLYSLLDSLFDGGFRLIDSLTKELRRIEVELFEKDEARINILRDILNLKRNIITMRSILFPQRAVVALLQHKNEQIITPDLALYFDDVSDAIERQWSLLETAKELSDALQETHESWLTYRTNSVIRVLTIFTVSMVPLTIITGLYGMNINLPLMNHPQVFEMLLSLMVLVMGGLLGYFAWKKWL